VAAAEAVVTDPAAGSTSVVVPSATLAVTPKDKTVTGAFGTSLQRWADGDLNVFVRGAGPVDEGNSAAPVILADLSGLRNVTKLTVGLDVTRWRWSQNLPKQHEVCRQAYGDPATMPPFVKDSLAKALAGLSGAKREHARDSVISALARVCVRHLVPEPYRSSFDQFIDFGHLWLAGVSADFGRKDYAFADTTVVAYRKRTEHPVALTIGGGIYLPLQRMLLATSLRYERSFETGPARDYCIPVGATSALQCRPVPLGAAERHEPVLWQVESRWFINTSIGLDPRVTVDLSGTRGIGIEMPLLVRQATEKGFNSAVTLGWRSKPSSDSTNDRFYIALTVGVTYSVGLSL
jgi:hypothetical protein